MLSQVYFRVNLRIDFLPATIIMRIENIFSLSVSDATLPKPTLEIIKVIKRKMVMIVVPSTWSCRSLYSRALSHTLTFLRDLPEKAT